MCNKNTKKNHRMKCALFSCKGEKGMDNSGYLNGLHYFTFCNEPAKNTLRHMYAYSLTFPLPSYVPVCS